MAQPIEFTPRPPPTDPARAEVEELVEALHETGLLRALTGAVQAYPELTTTLVQRLDPDAVRSIVRLGSLLSVPDPEDSRAVVDGARSAVAAANDALTGEAPSMLALVREVGSPDVRRGLGAVVAALGALGAFGRQVGRRHG